MARLLPVLFLTLVLAMVVSTSAEIKADWTNIQAINYTINDPASDGMGYLPYKICIDWADKLPEIAEIINGGKVTLLCPSDQAIAGINASHPITKYLLKNDTSVWTNLLKYHILKGHYVSEAAAAPVGSGVINLSQAAVNFEMTTILGIKIFATMKRVILQIIEERVEIGVLLPDDTTSIQAPDLYNSLSRRISLQGLSGILLPKNKEDQCKIAPAICGLSPAPASPPPASPTPAPPVEAPSGASPPPASPTPAPPVEAPSGAPRVAATLTMGLLLAMAATLF